MEQLGERETLTLDFVDIFAWEIDFHSDPQPGDRFAVVVEKYFVQDTLVKYGRILYADYQRENRRHQAFFFESPGNRGDYFTPQGDSLRKAFLRSPLKFTRISSGYTKSRRHPVLGGNRPHLGVDYAAPQGSSVWAVADGLGGHSEGEVASRMVCDALADWAPEFDFERTIDDARRRIGEVNDHLFRRSSASPRRGPTATTIVALLTRGCESAVVWAGDSRAYLWRGGALDRLTRDHSVAESEGPGRDPESNLVTRALGAEASIQLDVARFPVLPGDRFLLCSDGVSRVVSDAEIGRALRGPNVRDAVEALIQAALAAGGPDNITALVVEAY
jgi:serine/threonine protein phosphatase PrpC